MRKNQTIEKALPVLKEKGIRLDWFLKTIKMSRSHFYFVRNGKRPLTDEKRQKINEILETNF